MMRSPIGLVVSCNSKLYAVTSLNELNCKASLTLRMRRSNNTRIIEVDVKETSKIKDDRSQCSKKKNSRRTLYKKEAFEGTNRVE